jgi:2-iminobutanoate/2-iminopropanoate deaminase
VTAQTRAINAPDAPAAAGGYAQAVEVSGAQRLLFVSGQIPVAADGATPKDFTAQAELAWANVEAQLRAAGMTLDNLVKVTTFLADRAHAIPNREVRNAVLAGRTPALTVIITGIFDPDWLIEIEAVAAD